MATTLMMNVLSDKPHRNHHLRTPTIKMASTAEDGNESRLLNAVQDADHRNYVVEWNDLNHSIPIKTLSFGPPFFIMIRTEDRMILKPQSGFIKSGTLTALMGPSGSGKTTLLNCLLDKFKFGNNLASQDLKISFVPQKDHLFEELTVRESILIAYKFKRSSNDPRTDANHLDAIQRVESLASDLNLVSCLDVKVSKLSGGQMKRLSVGVELVSTPDILILDEPTSGLDATNALMIIRVIKHLFDTSEGVHKPAVICSIHQPSFACLNMFDKVYLLSQNGSKIFFDAPSKISQFLNGVGIQLPDNSNPGDYLLDASYLDQDNLFMASQNIVNHKKEEIFDVICHENYNHDGHGDSHDVVILPEKMENAPKRRNVFHIFTEIFLLFNRNYLILKSNPTPIIIRILFTFLNVNTLWMYNHSPGHHDGCWSTIMDEDKVHANKTLIDLLALMKDNDGVRSAFAHKMEQVNDNITLFLMMCNIVIYFNIMLTVATVPLEVKIIQKEVSNSWYSVNAYIASRILFFFPLMTLQIFGYVTISYLSASQVLEAKRLIIFIIVFMFLAFTSEIVGVAIGALFAGNVTTSTIVAVLYTFPLILFGGYFIHEESSSAILSLIVWISQVKHLLDACVIAIYGLGRCNAEDGTAMSINHLASPKRMVEKIFIEYEIDAKKSKFLAPLLGVPDDFCMEQVINGTRDYLGLNYSDADDDYDADVDIHVDANIDAASYSYPMTLFKLKDEMLSRCFISLSIISIFYILLAIFSIRRLLRQNK